MIKGLGATFQPYVTKILLENELSEYPPQAGFVDLHSQNVPAGMYPVIVVDMWQHAYYKDYLKNSNTYLKAMMKQLRWSVIEKRFEKADKILQVVRG